VSWRDHVTVVVRSPRAATVAFYGPPPSWSAAVAPATPGPAAGPRASRKTRPAPATSVRAGRPLPRAPLGHFGAARATPNSPCRPPKSSEWILALQGAQGLPRSVHPLWTMDGSGPGAPDAFARGTVPRRAARGWIRLQLGASQPTLSSMPAPTILARQEPGVPPPKVRRRFYPDRRPHTKPPASM
jgi:hypothetical protein